MDGMKEKEQLSELEKRHFIPDIVKRYTMDRDDLGTHWMEEDEDGDYVLHSDYAAIKMRLEELEASQTLTVKPLMWKHDPTGYFREYVTTNHPPHYYITLESYDTYMLVRHDGRNMGRGGVEDLKDLAQKLHEREQ